MTPKRKETITAFKGMGKEGETCVGLISFC